MERTGLLKVTHWPMQPSKGPAVEKAQQEFINKLIDNLHARFPQEAVTVISSFHVLTMRGLSFIPASELEQHGMEHLECLIEHYGAGDTEAAIIDDIDTWMEFAELKQLLLD